MENLEAAAKALQLPTENEADWLGRLNKVIRDLSDKKRMVMDELPGPVDGKDYRIVESRSAKRSYNTAGLMASFGAKGWDLPDLLASDAVRLSWRWTELKRVAERADVTLTIAHHEVEDEGEIDSPLIGEVWNSRYNIEGKS